MFLHNGTFKANLRVITVRYYRELFKNMIDTFPKQGLNKVINVT